jgi:multisubunit Na+/H+ antiporter MnhE subunit
VRHVVAWIAWWAALCGLWLLLAGEWNRQELIAAASASAIAATLAELARARAGVSARVPRRFIVRAWSVPLVVVVDFGLLAAALARSAVRRRVVRGTFRAHRLDVAGDDAAATGVRAWIAVAATYSPNAYVLDIDDEDGTVLLHDLVPFGRSREPA